MSKIHKPDEYLEELKKSMDDKLFFTEILPNSIECFVDYGCADGSLIQRLQERNYAKRYIGYDNNPRMIRLAKKKIANAYFTTKWEDIQIDYSNSVLNISSVIHEVYSYGSSKEILEFWDKVYKSGFGHIVMRDMMLSSNINADVSNLDVIKVKNKADVSVAAYEEVWGSINIRRNLIEYLLKSGYKQNWKHELHENYFPLTVESLLKTIPSDYKILYRKHYILPYIKQRLKHEFDIDLNDATHFKIILQRKS